MKRNDKHRFAETKEHYQDNNGTEHYQDDDGTSTYKIQTHNERPPNKQPNEYMNEGNGGNRKPLKETKNGIIPNARS